MSVAELDTIVALPRLLMMVLPQPGPYETQVCHIVTEQLLFVVLPLERSSCSNPTGQIGGVFEPTEQS